MAVTTKTFAEVGLKEKVDSLNLVAFLLNDSSNVLSVGSSLSDAASLELPAGNGYNRQAISLPSSSIVSGEAQSQSNDVVFQASGGNIPQFSHLAIILEGSTTVGSTAGTLLIIEPVNQGVPLSLNDGESYVYSALVALSGEFG